MTHKTIPDAVGNDFSMTAMAMKSSNHDDPLDSYKSGRKINFGAGPAALPLEVLKEFSRDMINLEGAVGVGIGELSHRTGEFEDKILGVANRRILDLIEYNGEEWQVLWMTGGGTGQFAAIPLNFGHGIGEGKDYKCLYLITGTWSEKAAEEAKKLIKYPGSVLTIDLRTVKGTNDEKTSRMRRSLLEPSEWISKLPRNDFKSLSYIYYCDNETVDGIELPSSDYFQNIFAAHFAGSDKFPIFIGDLSSNFLSRQLPDPAGPTGLLFAGVQKNLGPAGVTVVLIKRSVLEKMSPSAEGCPSVFDYKVCAKNNSLLNTPPVMSIHLCNLVLKALKSKFPGGLEEVNAFSKKKSGLLYDVLDDNDDDPSNKFYCDVDEKFRSRMNVVFKPTISGCESERDSESERESSVESFLKLSNDNQMIQLKGHRSVGGLRASLYNAITEDQVKALVNLLKKFSSNSPVKE